jgi:copper(I)-binding protein
VAPTAPAAASNLIVKDAWARPTIATAGPAEAASAASDHDGMQTDGPLSAAYMTIENTGGVDRLVGVSGDVAAMIQVHQTKESNGMMVMEEVMGGVDVPANGTLELKPGGYHVMLMNVTSQLKPGDTFRLTLTFGSGKEITVDVMVREP